VSLARSAVAVCVLLGACGAGHLARGPLVAVETRALPVFTDDLTPKSLRSAVERMLPAYARAGDTSRAAAAREVLRVVEEVSDPRERSRVLGRDFRIVRVTGSLLLTAYHEPELAGRLLPDKTFRFPIYRRPPKPVDLARREIDAGALRGRGLELAWTDDPVALFLLHVQGSGHLRLPDGARLGLRYAGTNGRPYTALGRTLIARGLLPNGGATIPDIRRVLATMPLPDVMALLATNERYTFFRVADGGPIGSLGVELTPKRSVATDPKLVPPGTIGYLVTPSVRRFVVSQDTGAAITGAHVDLFLGGGAEAEAVAGRMQDRGTLYLLLPR
jgi:membrane-bound lytic murein transglycosylase A